MTSRREFVASLAVLGLSPRFLTAANRLQIAYRKPSPYAEALAKVDAESDVFACEKEAAAIEAANHAFLRSKLFPLAPAFTGSWTESTQNVSAAIFAEHARRWIDSLGQVRAARFYALPGNVVRYEISATDATGLSYRVGEWRQQWVDGKLKQHERVSEKIVRATEPFFRDVTGHAFRNTPSFSDQLQKGNPYWRSRLDLATGIDIYGNNGIAVGDIDNDGRDEIYVCQPGGLPNRLYKWRENGTFEDITEQAGLAILDETTCALFADFRNSGHQDLVVLRGSGPLLFLNDGTGRFRLLENAFRFRTPPQGSFTGMSAADYDRDGKLDLYLCSYVYFQSEDQYRYPAPYHDAQHGPPNFLFHNALTGRGEGAFEDVTALTGMDYNNNRYSFAPAWCDFDGDGWPDLYVANDFGRNNLYRNRAGRFHDEAAELGVEDTGPGMSASWFDYDGDGKPDLYVSNMWNAPGQRVSHDPAFGREPQLPREAYQRHARGDSLFRNSGSSFADASASMKVEMGRWAWSSGGFDFDNDGRPEIFITCGMLTNEPETDLSSFFWRQVVAKSPAKFEPAPAYENGWNAINQLIREGKSWNGREPNVFYRQVSAGEPYTDCSGVSGLDFADDSRAFAVTDIDNDGNLDIVLKSRLGPQVRVLQNCCGRGQNIVVLKLRGTHSNRDAIGARITVNGQTKWVEAGSGFLSQHTKQLHFALGDKTGERALIVWPSGLAQQIDGLQKGQRYEIVEGDEQPTSIPLATRTEWPATHVAGENEQTFASTWLLEPVPLPEKRTGPGFLLLHVGETINTPQGVPLEAVDLSRDPDRAAAYSLFRRYLFDLRKDLATPLLLLIDEQSRAQRIYANIPSAEELKVDLSRLNQPDQALPFPGRYYATPTRNYYKLGAAFYQAGYPDQALPYLYETVRRAPDNWKAWLSIGQLHADADRQREALDAFDRVLQLRPDHSMALLYAGECEGKRGNTTRAETLFKRALAADAGNSDAANQLGLIAAQADRADEAKRFFEQAISLRRDHSLAINNLGVLYMKQGKVEDAIAAFQYGIQVAPEDDNLYLNLGRVYVARGNRGKAREVMQQLLDRKPNDAIALRALQDLSAP